jgi:hypothetical protein
LNPPAILSVHIFLLDSIACEHLYILLFFFEAEGFGLPSTAWAGSGLLVKSRSIRIRADEGARERTRSFEIELLLAAAGLDIPTKRGLGTP